nr:reverse transcriptase domain-containing protein [Tanacetum cinerariifolium]
MPRECLAIIESKSKVRYSRNKPVVAKVSTNTSTSGISPDVVELKDMVKALLLDKKSQNQAPATMKAVEESYVVENKPEATKDTVTPPNNGSTKDVQPLVIPTKSLILNSKPVNFQIIEHVASPVSALSPNQRPSIPYPSILQDQKLRDKANDQSLADLGVSINLMPLSVWNKRSLPDLSPTYMTLELVDRSISRSVGVAKDVYVKVGTFHFLADFDVVDFDADPRIPLILGRYFLKTGRALIDVFEEVDAFLALKDDPTSPEFDQSYLDSEGDILLLKAFLSDDPLLPPPNQGNYLPGVRKKLKICEAKPYKSSIDEPPEEVLGFFDVIASGNPTPYYDLIVSTTSLTLTPFGNSDFLLEEVNAFLALKDDPTSPKVDQAYLDYEGDILLLEAFLNDDPSLPPPNQGNYMPEVELKDLPPHLEYAFLEGDDKLPVIITKDLSMEEKTALITVLKSHKRAIAWKLSNIKGIDPEFYIHKILMEEDFEPAVQHQRREKSHFMVNEGIVLGHKISKEGIEVDKAKVDVISKLPHSTTVKGIRSFLGHAGIYRSKTMTEAESNYTTTEKEMLAVVYPFEKVRSYLIMNKSIVYTDHSALKYLFAKKDSKARLLCWVLLL